MTGLVTIEAMSQAWSRGVVGGARPTAPVDFDCLTAFFALDFSRFSLRRAFEASYREGGEEPRNSPREVTYTFFKARFDFPFSRNFGVTSCGCIQSSIIESASSVGSTPSEYFVNWVTLRLCA